MLHDEQTDPYEPPCAVKELLGFVNVHSGQLCIDIEGAMDHAGLRPTPKNARWMRDILEHAAEMYLRRTPDVDGRLFEERQWGNKHDD